MRSQATRASVIGTWLTMLAALIVAMAAGFKWAGIVLIAIIVAFVLFALARGAVESWQMTGLQRAVSGSSRPSVLACDAAARGDTEYLISALADPEMRAIAAWQLGRLRAEQAVPARSPALGVRTDLLPTSLGPAAPPLGD